MLPGWIFGNKMKGTSRQKGYEGESIALDYLLKRGYSLFERNYRYGRCEVDLVVTFETILIFVEVKLRETTQYGFPEDFFSELQAERIRLAAENFVESVNWIGSIRFDLVSIETDNGKKKITHFEDAF